MKGKVIYIIAAILLTAGFALAFLGFAIGGFSFRNLSTVPPYEDRLHVEESEVTSIQLKDHNTQVEFVSADVDNVRVEYMDNEYVQYSIENKGGELIIQKEEKKKWGNTFFAMDFSFQNIKMTITVPENFRGGIHLKTSNSNIDVSSAHLQNATLISSNGKIQLEQVNIAGNLDIKTSNARIILENVDGEGSMTAHSSNGRITIHESSFKEDAVCRTTNSGIDIKNATATRFDLDTGNGEIDLSGISALREVLAKTSNSDIDLTNVDVGESIVCITSNGNIEGTVFGAAEDFSLRSKTSNGSNNLPSDTTGGEKQAEFQTSNSDIEIYFISADD